MFQGVLGVPQAAVQAALFQQLPVGAPLRHGAMLQDVDLLGVHHIGQPVGDEQHCLFPCQLPDDGHDVVLALHVDVGGGLVEKVHRAAPQKAPGQGQPLPLPAGEVASPFQQLGGKPLLPPEEGCQVHLFQRLPQLLLGGVRAGQAQVLLHRALEEIALVADVGDVFQQALLRQPGELNPAHRDGAGIAPVPSGEQRRQGGLPAAGLPHQGGKAAGRTCEGDACQHLPAMLVGEAHTLAADGTVLREGLVPGRGDRQV